MPPTARASCNWRPGKSLILDSLSFFWLLASLTLAGNGIRTESSLRAVKSIEGSLFFTLSLPVSRLKLFSSRVIFGMLVTAGIIVTIIGVTVLIFPEVRAQANAADALSYALTVLSCSTAEYSLSTLVSTFLDQQWQVFVAMIVLYGLRWLSGNGGLPPSLDLFHAIGSGSPLLTHALPWPAIAFSLSVTAICLAAAAAVIQRKEY